MINFLISKLVSNLVNIVTNYCNINEFICFYQFKYVLYVNYVSLNRDQYN